MFNLLDLLDNDDTETLFTPCRLCGHAHHCNTPKCKECDCNTCECPNCVARMEGTHPDQIKQLSNKNFI
jgi:hypothetical protein